MDFFPYVMAFVAIFLGWAQWISLSRKLAEVKAERDLYGRAIVRLYAGMFVGGCAVHREGTPCIDRAPLDLMIEPANLICPPCWGRKVAIKYRVERAVDRIDGRELDVN